MKYEVVWLPTAEQELAEIWLAATERQLISQSAAMLDRELAANPESVGESRADGRQVHFAGPLGVVFRHDPKDRRVIVLHVWEFRLGTK